MASYGAVYDDGLSLGEPVFTVTTPRQPRVQLCTGASGGHVDYAQSAFFGRRPPQHIAGGRNWCSSYSRWNAPLGGQPGAATLGDLQSTSRLDVFTGMTFSNLVMFAIIVATAQTLHAHGKTSIQSAAQAAQALTPFAGHFASALFALGFIGSGMLAIPVLAGAGSVGMAGLLGKQWGFERSIRKAPVFYGLVALGTALSLLHVNPIKLLVFVAVINGVAAAPFLVVVMRISGSRRIMGDYVNGNTANILGWLTAALMAAAAISLLATAATTI